MALHGIACMHDLTEIASRSRSLARALSHTGNLSVVTLDLQYSRPGGHKHAHPFPKPGEDPKGRWADVPCRYCWDPHKGALLGGVGKTLAPVYSTWASHAFRASHTPSAACWDKYNASAPDACEWVRRSSTR